MKRYVVGITGASGPIVGLRLVEELLKAGAEVHLIISHAAFPIIEQETSFTFAGMQHPGIEENLRSFFDSKNLHLYPESFMEAPVASGSFITEGMFIAPCSMKTLSAVASGYASNLIERAADVTLKEGRRLILCPREMPFSAIHLENMLKLARLGATVAPPVAAFYQRPGGLDEMVNFFVGKLLDAAGLPHGLFRRWRE